VFTTAHTWLENSSWTQRTLCIGLVLTVLWMAWDGISLNERVLRDGLFFLVGPGVLGVTHGRTLGWRVDRRAIRYTVLLCAFVLPFYLVGSTLPSIREFYPMWALSSADPSAFLPYTIKQFLIVLATETYYRGLLCVGLREHGYKVIFISPVVYALQHTQKPPIELLLSGPTDVLFGAVDYRTNSLLPSVCAHGLGLTLLDWLVLHPPLFDPDTTSRWLRCLPTML
jgi:membrane protease YdiL (CAAX protease family)